MKAFTILMLIMNSSLLVYGQAWRDSLETARSLYRKGDYGKALRYYESAQKNAPEGIDLSEEMGQSAYKLRDFERAEKIYRQTASEKKSKADRSRSYHNLGNARMKKKDYPGAIEAYKEALKNNPGNDKTRYNLSEALRRLKEEQKKNEQQDKEQDQKDQDQQDQQGNNGQPQSGNRQNKKNQGNNKGNNKTKGNGGNNNKNSGLPNRSVERMLDELTKAEAATKRRMGGNQGESATNSSGKDW